MNELFSSDISLNHDTHIYTLASNPKATFNSTTTVLHSLFAPFEKEKIAERLVSNVPKYASYTAESLIAEWDQAGIDGTTVHNELEDYINDGTLPVTLKGKQGLAWLNQFTKDKYNWYSEVIIYSTEFGISGTIDLLVHDPIKDIYTIIDWKTNKAIKKRAFGRKKGLHFITKHLPDSNYWHYALQLSMYRLILEEIYGKTVKTQALVHLSEGDYTEYELPYLKEEVARVAAANIILK